MTRGIGEADAVRGLPDVLVAAAGLVTQLGDVWFFLVGLTVLYWLAASDRWPSLTATPWRDCLFLFALVVGGHALVVVLKHAFALPRPPGATTTLTPGWLPAVADPVYESLVTADGYGFPSGHATKATAVYGGAAVLLGVETRRQRFAIAAVVVALVSLSRVALGVHYLVDVLVGVALGAAFAGSLLRGLDASPGPALLVATGLGVAAFATAVTVTAGLTVVAGIAGLVAWQYTSGTVVRLR